MPVKSYGFAIGNLAARQNTLLKKSFSKLNEKGGLDKIVKILDLSDEKFNLQHEIIVK